MREDCANVVPQTYLVCSSWIVIIAWNEFLKSKDELGQISNLESLQWSVDVCKVQTKDM